MLVYHTKTFKSDAGLTSNEPYMNIPIPVVAPTRQKHSSGIILDAILTCSVVQYDCHASLGYACMQPMIGLCKMVLRCALLYNP